MQWRAEDHSGVEASGVGCSAEPPRTPQARGFQGFSRGSAVQRSEVLFSAVLWSGVQFSAVHCCPVSAVKRSAAQHNAEQHSGSEVERSAAQSIHPRGGRS